MAKMSKKKPFLTSLLEDMARTMNEGDAAVERCLAGAPQRGDQRRIESYKALAEWMLGGKEGAPT